MRKLLIGVAAVFAGVVGTAGVEKIGNVRAAVKADARFAVSNPVARELAAGTNVAPAAK